VSRTFYDRVGTDCHELAFATVWLLARSHGVMVSTQDSESCDPSSNLGGTLFYVGVGRGMRLRRDCRGDSIRRVRAVRAGTCASIAQWLEHQSSTASGL
jgi:hypothetical protein